MLVWANSLRKEYAEQHVGVIIYLLGKRSEGAGQGRWRGEPIRETELADVVASYKNITRRVDAEIRRQKPSLYKAKTSLGKLSEGKLRKACKTVGIKPSRDWRKTLKRLEKERYLRRLRIPPLAMWRGREGVWRRRADELASYGRALSGPVLQRPPPPEALEHFRVAMGTRLGSHATPSVILNAWHMSRHEELIAAVKAPRNQADLN